MNHAFIDRLQWLAPLEPDDRALLQTLGDDIRHVGSKRDVISDGEQPNHVHLMISGWAARYKILPDGKRQITAFLLPGDFCDAHITMLKRMDHGIGALGPVDVAYISRNKMDELAGRPAIAKALWFASLIDEGVLRAWIVNLGRRDAAQGVAHLMCELHARLKNVSAATDTGFDCPLSQAELGDALGLTPVHVNRVLRLLREEGALNFQRSKVVILDLAKLQQFAGFDPSYLHMQG